MSSEEIVALECPYCHVQIVQPLGWFKQTYATCPICSGGLAAGQFAPLIEALEQAFDASVEEMIIGSAPAESGCATGGCGGGGCGQH